MKALPIITLLTAASISMVAVGQDEAAPANQPAAEVSAAPSRFLAEDLDERLRTMRVRLAIAKRERGPFGLYQVPGKTPVFTPKANKKVVKTPFSDYINQIEISVINAKGKEFLVGARMFRLGQVFPIVGGAEQLSVRVESVSSSQVSFRNLKTGEVALRRLDILPAGVTASVGDLKVRGVTSNRRGEAAPLHLNLNSPPLTP